MINSPATKWLSKSEKIGIIAFFIGLIAFGLLVEKRSAFLSRRMGDLDVYLRAGWAIRSGADLYAITDENHWHYCYPPLLAILMVPLANPPAGVDHTGYVPYAVSVAIWYMASVLCLAVAVHLLANALERRSLDPEIRNQPRGCRRWWALRLLPVLVCLPPIGHTLMRGQTNLIMLLLLCGTLASALRGRRVQAGVWLAGAICLKVYPAFLLLYPLWRRDVRFFSGCVLGLFLGLIAIPGAALGPVRTWKCYEEFVEVMVQPGLGAGQDQSRAKELINVTATDSQSILATMHNTLHLDRWTRPAQPSTAVRLTSWCLGGLMTLLALIAAGKREAEDGPATVLFLGALIINMILLSPVCHLHYFCLAVPLVMGLIAVNLEKQPDHLSLGTALLLLAGFAANVPGQIQGLEVLRDCGLAMYGGLVLWAAGVVLLWQRTTPTRSVSEVFSRRAA